MKARIGLVPKEEVLSFLTQIAEEKEYRFSIGVASIVVEFFGLRQKELYEALQQKFFSFLIGDRTIEEAVNQTILEKKKKIAFAESCTAGLLGAAIVKVPGASLFFQGSIVAYANSWKERFLHVRRDTLRRYGAVSQETLLEMIEGLFIETDCDYALAVTGFLGPFEEEKAAEVFIGIAKREEKVFVEKIEAPSDRKEGMEFVVETALFLLWKKLIETSYEK